MKRGRRLKPLDLAAEERAVLEALVRRSTIQQRLALHACVDCRAQVLASLPPS